jgi:hypothetical protein
MVVRGGTLGAEGRATVDTVARGSNINKSRERGRSRGKGDYLADIVANIYY